MFNSILKKTSIQFFFPSKKSNPNLTNLKFLQNSITKNIEEESPKKPCFTTSYLINSCGLSPQSALSTSKKFQLKNPENSDSLIQLLKSQNFTNAQITKLVTKCPKILSINLNRIIKPKLEYFQSIGYTNIELATLLSSSPHILTTCLEKRLKPNFELLFSVIGSTKNIASAVRQTSRLLQGDLERDFLPNVNTLRSRGLSDDSIAKLASNHPRVILLRHDKFLVKVELVNEMGFNPKSSMFVHGVAAVGRFNPTTWEKKMALFKRLGWSEEEVILAFSKQPFCILLSDEKVKKMMEFYVRKFKWSPSFLAARPVLLCMSLEKRVVPRCSVMTVLDSKGLVMWNSTVNFLMLGENDFLNKYVNKYKNEAPEVLEVYNGTVAELDCCKKSTARRKEDKLKSSKVSKHRKPSIKTKTSKR